MSKRNVGLHRLTAPNDGYRVLEWQVEDAEGDAVDPDQVRWGDDDLRFIGNKWELMEVSICTVVADPASGFRNNDDLVDRPYFPPAAPHLIDIRARMMSRQRMVDRQSELQRDR